MTTRDRLYVVDPEGDLRPKAMSGVALSPRKEVPAEEIERAESELRTSTKAVARDIEDNYWELGRCLWEVYDGVPGGYRELLSGPGSRTNRAGLFKKWGYDTFEDYCSKELGLMKRSSENLRFAYYWFEIVLQLPIHIKDQVRALGRSKVYLLSGIVKNEDVMAWLEKARDMTHEQLKKTIKNFKSTAGGSNADSEEVSELGIGEDTVGDDGHKAAPAPEQMHTVHTSLYKGQFETWQNALAKAQSVTKSEKIGHNLELICQDFLMNTPLGSDSAENVKSYINKIECYLGIKLIAIDPSSGKPVYGQDLLWLLVSEGSKSSDSGEPK